VLLVMYSFDAISCLVSSLFIYPSNAQLDCSKRMLKFTLQVLLHVSV